MEPEEPIRGKQDCSAPTDRSFLRPQRGCLSYVADVVMVWLALCGLANVAVGCAALLRSDIGWLALMDPTPVQIAGWIAIYLALSASGFIYMLWQYHWRCKPSALLKVAAFLCVTFILVLVHPFLVVAIVGPVASVYTLVWAFCPKDSA
jgi:hypothetical protein